MAKEKQAELQKVNLPAYLLSLYAWIQAKHHEKERKGNKIIQENVQGGAMQHEVAIEIRPYKEEKPFTNGFCNCMKHGYRAKVFILYNPHNRHEGNWYMLDYRYTLYGRPEVGIWETDEHDNQLSIIDMFPISGKRITAENLERFIDEFDWKSYNRQKHPEGY